jgi:cold shock protein
VPAPFGAKEAINHFEEDHSPDAARNGYGFIQPQGGGKDVFVHIPAVEKAGLPGLNEGQVLEYEEVSNRGKTSAENLKVQR